MGVLRDPELQTVAVQTEETQQLMCQEVVIEELGRETAKNQLPHDVAIHCSDLTWRDSSTVSALFNLEVWPDQPSTSAWAHVNPRVISTVVEIELGYRQQDPGERQVRAEASEECFDVGECPVDQWRVLWTYTVQYAHGLHQTLRQEEDVKSDLN